MIKDGYKVDAHPTSDSEDIIGVNDRYSLSLAEKTLSDRIKREHMLNGVTIRFPETVMIGEDVEQTTIGGWVQDALERIPEVGDKCSFKVVSKILYDELNSDEGIEYVNLNFTVKEVVNNRITVLDLVIEHVDGSKEKETEDIEAE